MSPHREGILAVYIPLRSPPLSQKNWSHLNEGDIVVVGIFGLFYPAFPLVLTYRYAGEIGIKSGMNNVAHFF